MKGICHIWSRLCLQSFLLKLYVFSSQHCAWWLLPAVRWISPLRRDELLCRDLWIICLMILLMLFQPRSQGLSSPQPKASEGRKTLVQAGHVSWWQIYIHGRGPSLWNYCRRCCLLPPKPALWATMESSLSISQRIFVISSTLLSTFETKLGLETVKR